MNITAVYIMVSIHIIKLIRETFVVVMVRGFNTPPTYTGTSMNL